MAAAELVAMTAEPLSMIIQPRIGSTQVAIVTHAHQISIRLVATCAKSRVDNGLQCDLQNLVVLRHHCLVVLDLLGGISKEAHPCRCNLCGRVHGVIWQRAFEGPPTSEIWFPRNLKSENWNLKKLKCEIWNLKTEIWKLKSENWKLKFEIWKL